MSTILCSTRGGEDSIRTQDACIALARDRGSDVLFFMAFDLDFMAYANYALHTDIVREEMLDMSNFLMQLAVERAQQEQVPAAFVVREGAFRDELIAVVKEVKPSMVVLGRPGDDPSGEGLADLTALCDELQALLGIEFRILPTA